MRPGTNTFSSWPRSPKAAPVSANPAFFKSSPKPLAKLRETLAMPAVIPTNAAPAATA